MTLDELEQIVKTNIQFVDDKLSEANSPSGEDIEGIVGYGMELAAIISMIGKSIADAKNLLSKHELIFMKANEDLWEKPTVLKKLMEGTLADYYTMVIHADRLSAACTHKMDFYRSVLSKYKEELRTQPQFKQN